MPALLEVLDVAKSYDGLTAVDRVSFSVPPGEIFGLLGPNGAGKTSLIRMITDILRPDSGRILLFGEPMGPLVQDRVGYLPEERGLYQRQRVIDVLVFLGRLKGLTPHVAAVRAERALDRVGLLGSARRRLRELSKGMQQKLQIAAVLQHEPQLVILDEPFIGLDPINREVVLEMLRETVSRGASVLLSTHLMEQVEQLCTQAVLLHRGRIVLEGTVAGMRESHAQPVLKVECDRPLAGIDGVERADGPFVRLRDGATPESFLSALLAAGARVTRFERALPSLNEVFVKVVKDSA